MSETYRPRPVDTSRVAIDPSLTDLTETLRATRTRSGRGGGRREGWALGPARDDAGKRAPQPGPLRAAHRGRQGRWTGRRRLEIDQADPRPGLPDPPAARAGGQAGGRRDGRPVPGLPARRRPAGGSAETGAGPSRRWGSPRSWRCGGRWRRRPSPARRGRPPEPGAAGAGAGRVPARLRHPQGGAGGAGRSDVRLRQLHAPGAGPQRRRRLGRRGAPGRCATRGTRDEETLGTLARVYKDLWERATDPAEGRRWLELASAEYEASYRDPRRLLERDQRRHAGRLPGADRAGRTTWPAEVRGQCLRLLGASADAPPVPHDPADAYWPLATLGEAALVLGDFDRGGPLLRVRLPAPPTASSPTSAPPGATPSCCSATVAGCRPAAGGAGRRPAAPAAPAARPGSPDPDTLLDCWLPLPRVAVFTGHMIDRPGRAVAAVPAGPGAGRGGGDPLPPERPGRDRSPTRRARAAPTSCSWRRCSSAGAR